MSSSEEEGHTDTLVENDSSSNETPPKGAELQWFVVQVYSGFELKVKKTLEERIRSHSMSACFGEILVPQETVVEVVKGQKRTANKRFLPSYVLVRMALDRDTWHLVKDTPKVTGFLGGDPQNPIPITSEEVARIMSQVEEGSSAPRAKVSFDKGEAIRVIEGAFAEFNGTIEEVKADRGKVKVLISIFGRPTPVELDFAQVVKL
jgi:transcriptional antiterminator NusG